MNARSAGPGEMEGFVPQGILLVPLVTSLAAAAAAYEAGVSRGGPGIRFTGEGILL
jgi:hypothetical protein